MYTSHFVHKSQDGSDPLSPEQSRLWKPPLNGHQQWWSSKDMPLTFTCKCQSALRTLRGVQHPPPPPPRFLHSAQKKIDFLSFPELPDLENPLLLCLNAFRCFSGSCSASRIPQRKAGLTEVRRMDCGCACCTESNADSLHSFSMPRLQR